MVTFREFLYYTTGVELFTSEPLYKEQYGLPFLVKESGVVEQLPPTNTPDVKGFVPALTEQQKRANLYNTMTFKNRIVDEYGKVLVHDVKAAVEAKVKTIFANRGKYQAVSGYFKNSPIRWYTVGLLHELECSQNFNCYLGNGQRWDRKTTIVPKGRGPFKSFIAGAIDAIQLEKLDLVQDWSVGNMLYICEAFNGMGYSLYKGINSPYLFSGSNHYSAGKYVADSVYSKTAVSGQIGIALMYKRIMEKLGE